jgi:hypothetical protein
MEFWGKEKGKANPKYEKKTNSGSFPSLLLF